MVATVERGFPDADFWSMEIAGESPIISSTSGFCIWRKNCRAYAESDSTYRRCPSAKIVSNAREDFPEPESPVIAMSLFRGISTVMFFRLCVRAPLTIILSVFSELVPLFIKMAKAPHIRARVVLYSIQKLSGYLTNIPTGARIAQNYEKEK